MGTALFLFGSGSCPGLDVLGPGSQRPQYRSFLSTTEGVDTDEGREQCAITYWVGLRMGASCTQGRAFRFRQPATREPELTSFGRPAHFLELSGPNGANSLSEL